MINANKSTTPETLRRLKEGSEERFRIQLFEAVTMSLDTFEMTWQDLADKIKRTYKSFPTLMAVTGDELRRYVGNHALNVIEINEIAHIFSAEPYIIFRPRKPYTQT